MKRWTLLAAISCVLLSCSFASAETEAAGPVQLFYKANAYYEKGEYAKAIEEYLKILDLSIESGNLYYNIGNGFLKLGKIGYAIICYEKAKKLIPGDSDLRSNLDYARSLLSGPEPEISEGNLIVRIIKKPFEALTINSLAMFSFTLYMIVILILSLFIAVPGLARKGLLLFFISFTAFSLTTAAFILRYYDEEILKTGIVVQREAEAKYEPIEKSTTYYKLYEGNKAIILKTKNDWRQVRRQDGKIGWVREESIEEI